MEYSGLALKVGLVVGARRDVELRLDDLERLAEQLAGDYEVTPPPPFPSSQIGRGVGCSVLFLVRSGKMPRGPGGICNAALSEGCVVNEIDVLRNTWVCIQ